MRLTNSWILSSILFAVAGALFVLVWRNGNSHDSGAAASPLDNQRADSIQNLENESLDLSPSTELDRPAHENAKEERLKPAEDPYARLLRMRVRAKEWEVAENWSALYGEMKANELGLTRDSIEKQIDELTQAEMEILFAEGRYETLSSGTTYTSHHFNPYDVYWVRITPGVGVLKASLPEDRFLEVFNLRAHSAWLADRIRALGGQL